MEQLTNDPNVQEQIMKKDQGIRFLKQRSAKLVDLKNHYLHVILTPSKDQCSEHDLDSVLKCNNLLKYCVKSFKTAVVCYNNNELIDELLKIVLSC